MRIGVLALQGGFRLHADALCGCGVDVVEVRLPEDLAGVDGVVLPGGESTTMGKLLVSTGLLDPLRTLLEDGLPVLATCAGVVLLAREIVDPPYPGQTVLGTADVTVRRNAFGRQIESFEDDVEVAAMQGPPFPAVFVRAPWIESWGRGGDVLAWQNGRAVMARDGAATLCAFHPELTGDRRVHEGFLAGINV